jgi:ATPase subunit of ABC transporter with duplicated ATPase domains
MLSVHNISKSFGVTPVLNSISFNLNAGEKVGLVGPNGCGKTTLLRILAGQQNSDSGTFSLTPSGLAPGYLPQALEFSAGETLGGYLRKMQGDSSSLAEQLQALAEQMTLSANDPGLQEEYDAVLAKISAAAENEAAAPALLAAFELDELPGDLPVNALSGGQKTRLGLAGLLLSGPKLLLLDEPTNHLDFAMLEWLEDWIQHSRAAVLLVSHDRVFLDRTVGTILELDGQTHALRIYPGNYSDYLLAKEEERTHAWQEYSDQQVEIQRLKTAAAHIRGIATFRKGGKADTGDKFAKAFFANRSLATVKRAKSIEKRVEHLLTNEKVEKPRDSWQMKMEFNGTPSSSRLVLALDDLTIGYGEKIILSHLEQTLSFGERAVLVGANGCGKSTLLRTIAGKLPVLGGRVRLGPSVRLGFMAQEQEELSPTLTVLQTVQKIAALNETNARAFLHKFLFSGDEAFLPVSQCSFGMRSRLALACLVASGCNFLLLDEPLNHLDLPSRSQFERALAGFDGTILAVVHDRYFIQRFATRVWEIEEGVLTTLASI